MVVFFRLCRFLPNYKTHLEMALKFTNPSTFFAGPSGVGKTFWMLRFVSHLKDLCLQVKKMLFYYEVWQTIFHEHMDKITFRHESPSLEDLKDAEDSLLILDDLMYSISITLF